MKFFKIIFVFLFLTFFSFLSPHSSLAESEFSVDANVTYKVQENGKTLVTHDITLENLFSTLYATTYTLSLDNITTENVKSNPNNKIETLKDGDNTTIKLEFADVVVGRGEKRHFFISYENPSFAMKTGEVWEISIPKIEGTDNFKNYSINLEIPKSFGEKAYISPDPILESIQNSSVLFKFSKDDIVKTGVTAGFGQFQVFSYNLSYHLENPLNRATETQIALPPDTSLQKVYIEKIEPKPSNVFVDMDGNWIAVYKLTSRQRVDVMVSGSVQIFSGHIRNLTIDEEYLRETLKPSQYWQSDNPEIIEIAKGLKTPFEIYQYVSTKLKYDYSRVTPNVERKGSVFALKNPEQAICMEFTDLFIALARANGIPAREVNGFAYTENKNLQPLGLVADVLHSWPEYYDKDKKVWVPIDPTWGSTTGGEDFFNKLDLRHFTFVIHGKSDTKPYAPGSYKLGPNPQKDVYVSFGKLPTDKMNTPQISLIDTKTVSIENNGHSAIYGIPFAIYFDNQVNSQKTIELLPPYSKYTEKINIPISFLGQKTPNIIRVEALNTSASIKTNKRQVIIYSLAGFLTLLLLIFLALLIKLGKIRINVKKFFTRSS